MLGTTAFDTISAYSEKLEAMAKHLWENPEGPYREYIACDLICAFLTEEGFRVERGAGGVPTAIRASWGHGKPVIGFLGEYDALPDLSQKRCTHREPAEEGGYGQGCGHNLLGIAHLGAVIGLKKEMEEKRLSGTIVFFGCPAEEQLTGKGFMARGGAFDGLDTAVHFHPGNTNRVCLGKHLGANSVKFHYKGVASHAGGDPHNGRSALDAVELCNVGANYLREHVPTDIRIHYIITEGGVAPNIVPARATSYYFVRGFSRDIITDVYSRLVRIAQGAAMMTDTELQIEFLGGCYNTENNKALADVLYDAMNQAPAPVWTEDERAYAHELNLTTEDFWKSTVRRLDLPSGTDLFEGAEPLRAVDSFGSTDMGDVMHIVPGVMFYTTCYNLAAPGHSWQHVACAGMSIGMKGMLHGSRILALYALRLLTEPDILKSAKKEFDRMMDGRTYECPIPAEVPVP